MAGCPGAFESRANLVGFLDMLAVAAKHLSQLVVAGEAEVAGRLGFVSSERLAQSIDPQQVDGAREGAVTGLDELFQWTHGKSKRCV